jgi:hypothetical protein
MGNVIPSRDFTSGISYQELVQLRRLTTLNQLTYELDRVTEQGATFRMTVTPRYGTQKPAVYWGVVTPAHPEIRMVNSRKIARTEIRD